MDGSCRCMVGHYSVDQHAGMVGKKIVIQHAFPGEPHHLDQLGRSCRCMVGK